jgi:hypothetical protein
VRKGEGGREVKGVRQGRRRGKIHERREKQRGWGL